MPYSQEERLIALTTPLGEDVLLLAGFSGHEGISRLFSFNLDLLSEKGPIDFSDIIGKNVTICVTQSDKTQRYFNGIVSHFAQSGSDSSLHPLPDAGGSLVCGCSPGMPTARFFTTRRSATSWSKSSIDRGFQDYKFQLNGSYSPMEYCVQYRETDFNFVSRLMEQNGIFYFFQHEEGKHTMVIADSSSAHEPAPARKPLDTIW